MRKTVISIFLAMCSSAIAQNADWGNIGRYHQANITLLQSAQETPRVVLLGNSITDAWPGTHPDFFSENKLAGRGISGQTSYQFLVRFRDDVVNLNPAVVVINTGTNDVAENNYPFNLDRTLGNIKSMCEIAEANGIVPVLSSVLPAGKFPWRPEIEDVTGKIKALNKAIKAYADNKGYSYVDYYSAMVNSQTGAMADGLSTDGVHPNSDGYTIMEATLLPVLQKVAK